MNRDVVFIGGRRCHHMPTLVVKEISPFFNLKPHNPNIFHKMEPLPMGLPHGIPYGLLQDIGAFCLTGSP